MLMDNSPASYSRSQTPLSPHLGTTPPLTQPPLPSNTLLITNLQNQEVFRPGNLQTIRDLIDTSAPIHSWAPLKSFRRIIVSFYHEDSAIHIKHLLDGQNIMGECVRVYFGQSTPIEPKDEHLPLPDAGKLFFISPPPSPPCGWEMKLEGAPNKQVHAEDLVEALSKLHHKPQLNQPAFLVSNAVMMRGRQRNGSSTIIYRPEDHGDSPLLPAIEVEDLSDNQRSVRNVQSLPMPTMAPTSRPPV